MKALRAKIDRGESFTIEPTDYGVKGIVVEGRTDDEMNLKRFKEDWDVLAKKFLFPYQVVGRRKVYGPFQGDAAKELAELLYDRWNGHIISSKERFENYTWTEREVWTTHDDGIMTRLIKKWGFVVDQNGLLRIKDFERALQSYELTEDMIQAFPVMTRMDLSLIVRLIHHTHVTWGLSLEPEDSSTLEAMLRLDGDFWFSFMAMVVAANLLCCNRVVVPYRFLMDKIIPQMQVVISRICRKSSATLCLEYQRVLAIGAAVGESGMVRFNDAEIAYCTAEVDRDHRGQPKIGYGEIVVGASHAREKNVRAHSDSES